MAEIIDFIPRHRDQAATRTGTAEIVSLAPHQILADPALRHDPFGLVAAARALVASFEAAKRNANALAETSSQMRANAQAIATGTADLLPLTARLRRPELGS